MNIFIQSVGFLQWGRLPQALGDIYPYTVIASYFLTFSTLTMTTIHRSPTSKLSAAGLLLMPSSTKVHFLLFFMSSNYELSCVFACV